MGNTLVGVSRRDDAVFGYFDVSTIQSSQAPDFVIWYPGMEDPNTIHAVVR